MPIVSKVTIITKATGMPEGGSAQTQYEMVNTTGSRVTVETTFGAGVANATTWVTPVNARYMTIVMPTTNTNPWRFTASTAEVGIALSSQGANTYCLPDTTAGSTFVGYTSSTRAISGVRIIYS